MARMMLKSLPRMWVMLIGLSADIAAHAGDLGVHASGRYYQDATGHPLFLIGYYAWSAVPDGFFIDHPSLYSRMMLPEQQYRLNYIRISLGVNRMTPGGNPPSWNGVPTPVPFLYVKSGDAYKTDLDHWDPEFWHGLRTQCALARRKGFVVHVSIFDGVELRRQGGADFGYSNSFWNPSKQFRSFYPDPDKNHNGQIDEPGEFYNAAEFSASVTGGTLSYYQKKLIDKAATELARYDNVLVEVGNELLGSDAAWNTCVIRYIKSKTNKPVTECNNTAETNRGTGLQGWSQHNANAPAEVKANIKAIVGHGWPAWEDPDGSALSDFNVSSDDLRRAAWYAFAGGAACWGGFTRDFWGEPAHGFDTVTASYYKNLASFIHSSGVQFWRMKPAHELVSNSATNSCLADRGSAYLAYILKDATVTLDLTELAGNGQYKLYDPKVGTSSGAHRVAGGAVRNFSKPAAAADWVIYVYESRVSSTGALQNAPK